MSFHSVTCRLWRDIVEKIEKPTEKESICEPPVGTFHNFGGEEYAAGSARIDWILTRGAVTPLSTAILTFARDGQYPSDHFPVIARVEFDRCR